MKKTFSRVLITGTTSGLGRAFLQHYAKAGAEIIEVNRRALTPDSESHVVWSEVLDITSSGEVYTLLSRLQRAGKVPDLFILNAGINLPDCVDIFDYPSFQKVMNTNLNGVMTFISAIHRLHLKDTTIATVSSTSNIVPNSANIGYHLSKLNLRKATELLASRDHENTYKTVVLSPVHTNIQAHTPPSPGLTSLIFKLLAVSPENAAASCARFFSGRGLVFHFTKPACVFYWFIRALLLFFPFLYKGTKTSLPLAQTTVPQS